MSLELTLARIGLGAMWVVIAPQMTGIATVMAFAMGSALVLGLVGTFLQYVAHSIKPGGGKGPVVLLLASLLVLSSMMPASAQAIDPSWIPIPADPLPVDVFMTQFWAVVNWFSPLVLPVLGFAVMTVIIGRLVRTAFKAE